MFPMCRICKRIGMCCICGVFFCHCLTDLEKDKSPYVPPQEHTHQETYVMKNYPQNIMVNAASSSHHSGEIHFNLSDMRASRDTIGDGWAAVVMDCS